MKMTQSEWNIKCSESKSSNNQCSINKLWPGKKMRRDREKNKGGKWQQIILFIEYFAFWPESCLLRD